MVYVGSAPGGLLLSLSVLPKGGCVVEPDFFFGVTNVVEVNAVDVVVACYLFTDGGQIVSRGRFARVKHPIVLSLDAEFGQALLHGFSSQCFCFGKVVTGECHYPGMEFQVALVAFINGKLQGVIARVSVKVSGQAVVPGFQSRGINHGGTYARLQKDGVEVGCCQLVEYLGEFLFLSLNALGRVGFLFGPVEASDGGEPYGAHLSFGWNGLCLQTERQEECENIYRWNKRSFHAEPIALQKYVFSIEVKSFSYFCIRQSRILTNNPHNMKKWIITMLLLVFSVGAKAQFEAGTGYVGASVSNLGLSYSTTEKFRFGANLSIGTFLADQFMLRADLGYNHTDAVDDFSTALMGRYYFMENGIFVGAGGEFVHYTKSRNDVMIPIELGYCFYLNHFVSIEPSVYYKMSLDDFSDKSAVGFKIGLGFYF